MKAYHILQQYQNGQRNFQGLNLRGLNFAQKDLSGANFSHCDIRGANFKRANLTGTNFTEAKAGLQKRWVIGLLLVVLVLIVCSSYFSMLAGVFVAFIFGYRIESQLLGWLSFITLLTFCVVTYRQNLERGVTRAFSIVTAIFAAAGVVTVAAGVIVVVAWVTGQTFLYGASGVARAVSHAFNVAFALALAVAGAGVFAFAGAFTGVFAFAGASAVVETRTYAVFYTIFGVYTIVKTRTAVLAVVFAVVFVLFACFIGYRTLKDENREPGLRKITIAFAGTGGTSFYGATLTDADFTGATLKNTNFKQTILTNTCFDHTIKLNFAVFD